MYMKYLKRYNELCESIDNEVTDEIWKNIRDILLELNLESDDFVVSQDLSEVKNISKGLCRDVVEIVVKKHSIGINGPIEVKFPYKEIEGVFNVLIDYMLSEGFNYSISYSKKTGTPDTRSWLRKSEYWEFDCGGEDPLFSVGSFWNSNYSTDDSESYKILFCKSITPPSKIYSKTYPISR